MRKVLQSGFIAGMLALAIAFSSADGGDKGKNPPAKALPPHPLDGAFEKGQSERDVTNALLNNKLFQKAISDALKARRDQEARFKQNPGLADANPAQAARNAFLKTLSDKVGE